MSLTAGEGVETSNRGLALLLLKLAALLDGTLDRSGDLRCRTPQNVPIGPYQNRADPVLVGSFDPTKTGSGGFGRVNDPTKTGSGGFGRVNDPTKSARKSDPTKTARK